MAHSGLYVARCFFYHYAVHMENIRWILHVDMDAFYASVEQLDFPELRGKPVVVGGIDAHGNVTDRGVVCAASYEARAFGIRSAMPVFQARKLCSSACFVRVRHERYSEKSKEIMELLEKYSPLVEPASVDEAYLDLTGLEHVFPDIMTLARTLQRDVKDSTGLSCSVGIAPVKFLAKIASDLQKPFGLTILSHTDVPAFLATLAVKKIPGVGQKTLEILTTMNVHTAGDLLRFPLDFWQRKLGKGGEILYERAQGIDPRPVVAHLEAKSESAENTFAADTKDSEMLTVWLMRQSERVGASLRRKSIVGRTITLKVKYANFTQVTRARTLQSPTNTTQIIYETACSLLAELNITTPLRLIGVSVSQFGERERQLSLLTAPEDTSLLRAAAIDSTFDAVRQKFGKNAILRGKLFTKTSE